MSLTTVMMKNLTEHFMNTVSAVHIGTSRFNKSSGEKGKVTRLVLTDPNNLNSLSAELSYEAGKTEIIHWNLTTNTPTTHRAT